MTTQVLPAPIEDKIRSPWSMARRRFMRNHLAVISAIILTLLILACFATIPWSMGSRPSPTAETLPARYVDDMMLQHVKEPPTFTFKTGADSFWMGTDSLGRDLRARFLMGGAISLCIGLASAAIAVLIGTFVGLWAGYAGGRIDAALMRTVDVLYGLPYILLVIMMRVAFVPWLQDLLTGDPLHPRMSTASASQWANVLVLLVGIGAVSWLTLARVVRGQVLSLRDQPFVEAARALGYGGPRILARHILPNLVGTIVVYGTLTVPAAILSESLLSFLGLGIQPPLPSWGNLASEGIEALNPVRIRWWLIAWPCAGLSLALLCLNFVGDGVRDALDPKSG